MLDTFGGLPAHVLLVHAVVVLLPLAALMLVVGVLWPAARHKLGVLTPLVALVGLVLVPVTTHAGEWLQQRLPRTRAIQHHADLGHGLLPWAFGLFVLSAVVWWTGRRYELVWRPGRPQQTRPARPADVGPGGPSDGSGATATLARPGGRGTGPPAAGGVGDRGPHRAVDRVAVGLSITLYRIGDSGAHAVWNGVGASGR